MPSKSPNILFIMADQLAPQFLPSYGHRVVKAPALEKLAAQSVVFDAAYTNSPLCAPSRFSMMSGRLPTKIGAWDNAAEFPAEIPTYAHYLRALGYTTCLAGKMHFVGPDQLHGFDARLTTDVYPADFAWHPEWDYPDKRQEWFHNMEVVTKAGECLRAMYLDYDDDVLFKSKRYLFDHARDGTEQPFMLTVSFMQPHDPYLCRPERFGLYRDDDIDLPSVPLGSVAEDPHSRRVRHGYGATDIEVDEAMLRRARRAYYGTITDIDAKIEELLSALDEAGLADDTIIVFTSDHGDMLGERGMWFKMSFFEHSTRVPLMVHAPARFKPRRVAAAVSLIDLLPTFVDFATDGKPYDYATPIEGHSLLPHLGGAEGHDEVIGEYFGEGTIAPLFMLRRGPYKLVQCDVDPLQLYNLDDDPNEVHNLAGTADAPAFVDSWLDELKARYDCAALSAQVLESQRRRRFLKGVMRDQGLTWDYVPTPDAASQYVRNSVPIYQLEKRARFPQV